MRRTRRWVQRLLPVVVSAGALAVLFASIDPAGLLDTLSWNVALIFVPALLAYGGLSLAIEALSIVRLIRPVPPGFGLWTAARIKCSSYLLAIVNYALGAGALSVLLRRRAGLGLGTAAGVVLLISSTDLLLLLTLASAGTVAADTAAPAVRAGVLAAAGLGFVGGLTLLRAPASLGPLERIRSLAVFGALRTTPLLRLAELVGLRLLFTVSFVALGGAGFFAFGIVPPASDLVVGILIVALVATLPIAVAGLGTGQAAFVYVFRELADRETLLAVSLVLSTGMIALRAAMGLAFARELSREALEQTRGERA